MPGPIAAHRESCAIDALIHNIEAKDIRQET